MRGKEICQHFGAFRLRITPAYAGKRSSQRNVFKFFRDHPRLCGEKADCEGGDLVVKGSPPPMRGKVSSYAGKVTAETDHPRLCGEKFDVPQNFHMPIGSPPPMRGKDRNARECKRFAGITPAYAGKRCCRVRHRCC